MGRTLPIRGVTVFELLVVLAIAAVLGSLAAPSMLSLVQQQRATAAINAITGLVQQARHAAATYRVTVTLCAASKNTCLGRDQWHQGVVVFADHNGNGSIERDETVFGRAAALPAGARIYWRSFRNRKLLRFRSTGLTDWQNGHFKYCPADGNVSYARQIVINAAGRVRAAPDRDGDGVREDVRGRALTC